MQIIIPPKRQDEIEVETYYSFLLGMCIVRAMEADMFKKAVKYLNKNSSQTSINYHLKLKEFFFIF